MRGAPMQTYIGARSFYAAHSTKPDFVRVNLVKEDLPLSFLTAPIDSYSAN